MTSSLTSNCCHTVAIHSRTETVDSWCCTSVWLTSGAVWACGRWTLLFLPIGHTRRNDECAVLPGEVQVRHLCVLSCWDFLLLQPAGVLREGDHVSACAQRKSGSHLDPSDRHAPAAKRGHALMTRMPPRCINCDVRRAIDVAHSWRRGHSSVSLAPSLDRLHLRSTGTMSIPPNLLTNVADPVV